MDAVRVALKSPFRLLDRCSLRDEPARRRIPARKCDAGHLANETATAVATDEIGRAERSPVSECNIDAVVILREAGHLASAMDSDVKFVDPFGQDALDMVLPQS